MVRECAGRWYFRYGTNSADLGRICASFCQSPRPGQTGTCSAKVEAHPSWDLTLVLSRGARCAGHGCLGSKFSNQPAAHQPRQRLDEEIPGKVPMLLRRPCPHREMAHQDGSSILEKRKPGSPMRQPADILSRPAEQ